MASIKYAHLQVMGTITGKFHQNHLKTVGGVAETRLCLWTEGRTDGQSHYYSPLRLTSGDKNVGGVTVVNLCMSSCHALCLCQAS